MLSSQRLLVAASLAFLPCASGGLSASEPQESAKGVIEELRSARSAHRDRLMKSAEWVEVLANREAEELDAKGESAAALVARGRARLAASCRERLSNSIDASLDDASRLLEQILENQMPASLLREGMRACFLFRDGRGLSTVEHLSGSVVDIGAPEWQTIEGTTALAFSQGASVLKTRIVLEDRWTVIARAHFPASLKGQGWQNLLWGDRTGGADHVIIDKSGEVGVWQNGFHGSGFKVGPLKGWHTFVARAQGARTEFFLDGQKRGESDAAVYEPIQCIGNIGWQDREPQNLSVPLAGLAVYGRAFTDEEIRSLKDESF